MGLFVFLYIFNSVLGQKKKKDLSAFPLISVHIGLLHAYVKPYPTYADIVSFFAVLRIA